jgi:hypothetical protein
MICAARCAQCAQCAVGSVQGAARSVLGAACSVQRAGCSVQRAACWVQRTACSVQGAGCAVHGPAGCSVLCDDIVCSVLTIICMQPPCVSLHPSTGPRREPLGELVQRGPASRRGTAIHWRETGATLQPRNHTPALRPRRGDLTKVSDGGGALRVQRRVTDRGEPIRLHGSNAITNTTKLRPPDTRTTKTGHTQLDAKIPRGDAPHAPQSTAELARTT